jgi:hypothetical protein
VVVLIDVVSFVVKVVFIVEEDITAVIVAKKYKNALFTVQKLKNQNVLFLYKNFKLCFSNLFLFRKRA